MGTTGLAVAVGRTNRVTAFPHGFAVNFPVESGNRMREGRILLVDIRMVMGKVGGGPPGIRTLNQWIKSPLLCR